ncbi:GNAT family N-acetyltransferase [Luteimonas sp. MC1572]|uniref:GNAT family N-acetyltransferase n=1 Tax=Luteimonas sp. MC1572 TaxID=2799325 RepID=UPI0018F068B1|nr:GNAT family N-acetyltransferase [Luteimonas sp. MC1572]MBJ6980687.1 GNAT family N-acetyltransferase [Luteimonas sp. MC1572]QQO02062.1 GNAT family N-acetyltransferase [Luteimonas sp. MC1572]
MSGTSIFRVDIVGWDDAGAALSGVRSAVFVDELGIAAELENDGQDARCWHVQARDQHGCTIGAGRLDPDGRIGRMAVLPAWRDRGVGNAMLQALLRQARSAGRGDVFLHAQVDAAPFYQRNGFTAEGPRFTEAGITHQTMRLAFDHAQSISDREGAVAITSVLVASARRRLRILTRALDPGLYDDPRVLAALRSLATGTSGVEVQVLLFDAGAAQRAHSPLLALAQRLPSVFAFRELEDPVDRARADAFIVNDAGGYYHRGLGHRFDGEAQREGAGRARQLAEAFDPVWERSRPCGELRALGL